MKHRACAALVAALLSLTACGNSDPAQPKSYPTGDGCYSNPSTSCQGHV